MSVTHLLLLDVGNSTLKFQCHRIISSGASQGPVALGDVLSNTMTAPSIRLDNHSVTVEALQAAWQRAALMLDTNAAAPLNWQLSWSAVGPTEVMDCVDIAFSTMSNTATPSAHRPVQELSLSALNKVVVNRYLNPGQLGADRWISVVGAAASSAIPAGETHMIVSAGTATTIDLVRALDAEHGSYEFLGGWIFPGVSLMNSSLRQGTRDLQLRIDTPCVTDVDIPKDTRVAIAQGIGLAQTAWLAPLIERFNVRRIWLHGGAAHYWQEAVTLVDRDGQLIQKIKAKPNLIFTGLMALAQTHGLPA